MPTAAKLFAAVLFAALAWLLSEQIRELLPGEGRGASLLAPINALIGLSVGWRVIGARAGEGYVPSVGYGLTSVVVTFFWALLIWSFWEMLNIAVRGRYSGPIDALEGMGDLMLDYSATVISPNVIGTAVIGAAVAGVIVEFISRRWS